MVGVVQYDCNETHFDVCILLAFCQKYVKYFDSYVACIQEFLKSIIPAIMGWQRSEAWHSAFNK
jgi:hypothetical protein